MSGTFNLLQLWQVPSTKLLLRSSLLSKDNFSVLEAKICSSLCFHRRIQATTHEVYNRSYIPTVQNEQETKKMEKPAGKHETVGAFQKLPMVMPSTDIIQSALKKAKKVSPTKGIANIAKRERNKGARQLDALMKELAVPLRGYRENFPGKSHLHPYERSLIELTLGEGNYEQVLRRVDALRKKVVSVGKEHASLCAKSLSKREAEEQLTEGIKKLEEVFRVEGKAVEELLNIAKTLRALPVVDPETPTLCLVGAPNVGKSSLVRILSTGKPEICNYPFTTRGILMGHIAINYDHFQVTDTPGLLKRSDGKAPPVAFHFHLMEHGDHRNNLEKLTLAVLTHLPTAILYVHDLSGECGTSASDQFIIYKEIKERFRDHLWLDIVSKYDLLQDSPQSIADDRDEVSIYKKVGPDGAIRVSVKNELGVHELKARVQELLLAQMERIRTPNSNQESE